MHLYISTDIHYTQVLRHRFMTLSPCNYPDYTDSPNKFQKVWPSLYPAAEKAWQEITQQKKLQFSLTYTLLQKKKGKRKLWHGIQVKKLQHSSSETYILLLSAGNQKEVAKMQSVCVSPSVFLLLKMCKEDNPPSKTLKKKQTWISFFSSRKLSYTWKLLCTANN